jgi:hypothetical protein
VSHDFSFDKSTDQQHPRTRKNSSFFAVACVVGVLFVIAGSVAGGIGALVVFSPRNEGKPKEAIQVAAEKKKENPPTAIVKVAKSDAAPKPAPEPLPLPEPEEKPAIQKPQQKAASVDDLLSLIESQKRNLMRQETDCVRETIKLKQELIEVRNRYPSGSPGFSYDRISKIENRIRAVDQRHSEILRELGTLNAKAKQLQ